MRAWSPDLIAPSTFDAIKRREPPSVHQSPAVSLRGPIH
jgi:hypothetical protein